MKEIPVTSLQRLPIYLNYLKSTLEQEDVGTYVSSKAIADALNMGEVLVRKDLAYTSAVGKTRVGYVRKELIAALEEFLGCDSKKNAVIFGAGGLGRALLAYPGFKNYGINIVCAFDTNPARCGRLAGKPILEYKYARPGIHQTGAQLAIIATPASAAQEVADILVECGVKAILNFAPILLNVPDTCVVRNMDVAANLAILSSYLNE
ncbi:MAG: redox-sensing transcriptional repressor Rex [Clostridia bacterium]|nr:redox-sensing transcriptional repressor Rex [Clostridia bacterium]